jgi:hypothetical protein
LTLFDCGRLMSSGLLLTLQRSSFEFCGRDDSRARGLSTDSQRKDGPMALITRFVPTTKERPGSFKEAECGYCVVDIKGERLVVLDTYGSQSRKQRGKTSQTLHIDEGGARELIAILRSAFPRLK